MPENSEQHKWDSIFHSFNTEDLNREFEKIKTPFNSTTTKKMKSLPLFKQI